jgi:hypothetical protein
LLVKYLSRISLYFTKSVSFIDLTTPQSIFHTAAQEAVRQEIRNVAILYGTRQILREYAKVTTGAKDPETGKWNTHKKLPREWFFVGF